MERIADLVAHIARPANIEISDGVVHVREESGNHRIERTMSVKTARRTLDRLSRALERFAAGEQNVIVDD